MTIIIFYSQVLYSDDYQNIFLLITRIYKKNIAYLMNSHWTKLYIMKNNAMRKTFLKRS